jgi:GxxExxY protein
MIVLQEKGLSVQSQVPIAVTFHGQPIGQYFADLLVEEKVIVELKTVHMLLPEHRAQLIHYLRATGIPVGLLINFNRAKLEIKRAYWDGEDRDV